MSRVTLDFDDATAGRSGTHVRPAALRVFAAPSTSPASVPFNTIEPGLFTVACWRMDDLRFDFDSSFVLPAAKAEVALLAAIVAQFAGHPLSVFGHADPTGNDDYNKALSGRRATAIFAMVVRDPAMWEDLFSRPSGGDRWGSKQLRLMLDAVPSRATGEPFTTAAPGPAGAFTNAVRLFQQEHGLGVDGVIGSATRKELFLAYMDFLCDGKALHLTPEDFLGGGNATGGKGNFQGCSEFNPVLLFSKEEAAFFEPIARHDQRDAANSVNRRVVIFLFRKGTRVDEASWPCPRVTEGVAACKTRFWSDGDVRRKPSETRRHYEDTHDTFACRFYDRLAMRSPCEASAAMVTFHVRLCDFERGPIANAPFRIVQGTSTRTGTARDDGFVIVQALKRPTKLRVEWTFPDAVDDPEFPFRREFFVDVGDDDGADARRLFNLGYVKARASDNVRDYQRDFGHAPRTGKLDDIRPELRAFHDGGQRPRGKQS